MRTATPTGPSSSACSARWPGPPGNNFRGADRKALYQRFGNRLAY
jgi:hypothetical protein